MLINTTIQLSCEPDRSNENGDDTESIDNRRDNDEDAAETRSRKKETHKICDKNQKKKATVWFAICKQKRYR